MILVLLLPVGMRSEEEIHTMATRKSVTWFGLRVTPHFHDELSRMARWLMNEVKVEAETPRWAATGGWTWWLQPGNDSWKPGLNQSGARIFWHCYLDATSADKPEVIAITRQFFLSTDVNAKVELLMEALQRWPPP